MLSKGFKWLLESYRGPNNKEAEVNLQHLLTSSKRSEDVETTEHALFGLISEFGLAGQAVDRFNTATGYDAATYINLDHLNALIGSPSYYAKTLSCFRYGVLCGEHFLEFGGGRTVGSAFLLQGLSHINQKSSLEAFISQNLLGNDADDVLVDVGYYLLGDLEVYWEGNREAALAHYSRSRLPRAKAKSARLQPSFTEQTEGLLREAWLDGCTLAGVYLGNLLEQKSQMDEALKLYRETSIKEDVQGTFHYGRSLLNRTDHDSDGVENDALELLANAADKSHTGAQYLLATFYQARYLASPADQRNDEDLWDASSFFESAANQGHAQAQLACGQYCQGLLNNVVLGEGKEGIGSFTYSLKDARKWYQKAHGDDGSDEQVLMERFAWLDCHDLDYLEYDAVSRQCVPLTECPWHRPNPKAQTFLDAF